MIFNQRPQRFTLFPHRFRFLFWDDCGNLTYVKWWQWCFRRFYVDRIQIVRPHFSDWEELQDRVMVDDVDACLIRHLISRTNQEDQGRFYKIIVTETRDKYHI